MVGARAPGTEQISQRVSYFGWNASWDAPTADLDNTVYALARLCLLTELRQEKGFLLHMATSQYGILKPLVQASVAWNNQRDTGTVTCNLTCLFRLMVQELMARLEKLQGTLQSISEATSPQWVTDNPLKWLYHRWNPALTKLELDPTQAGLPQDQLISLLEGLDTALKQDSTVLCQFKALRPLSEEMRGESVAFKISVALRGPAAATLHQGFAALDGCMALQLIGANLHRERQSQCKEANLVRECVFGRPSSGPSFSIRLVPMPATLTPPSYLSFTLVTQCRILMCCWGVWLLSGRLYNRVVDPSSCVT